MKINTPLQEQSLGNPTADVQYHIPVLLEESIEALRIHDKGIYIDATMGGAGHTHAILKRLGSEGHLYSFDQDSDARANAPQDDRLTFIASNFRHISHWMAYYHVKAVDGILADLGVSSHHFDCAARGFSFRFGDSPLDMRMNNQTQQTATTLLQTTSEEELFQLFRQYGELADAGRIASLIVANRTDKPLATTDDLLTVIDPILPRQPQQRHRKLSRIYQSLRIAVNDELTALEEFLTSSIELLAPKGRLVVLTYHSLEDRLVKEAYRKASITAIFLS